MAIFEVQGPDGKTYEVDAPDAQTASAAFASPQQAAHAAPNFNDAQARAATAQAAQRSSMDDRPFDPAQDAQGAKDTEAGVAEGGRLLLGGVKQLAGNATDAYNKFVKGTPTQRETLTKNPDGTFTRDQSPLESSKGLQATAQEVLRQTVQTEEDRARGVNIPDRNAAAGATQLGTLALGPEAALPRATTLTGAMLRTTGAGAAGNLGAFDENNNGTRNQIINAAAGPVIGGALGLASSLKNVVGRALVRVSQGTRSGNSFADAVKTIPSLAENATLTQRTGVPELKTLERAVYDSRMVEHYAKQTDDFVVDAVNALKQPVKDGQNLADDFVAARTKASVALRNMKMNASSGYDRGIEQAKTQASRVTVGGALAPVPTPNFSQTAAKIVEQARATASRGLAAPLPEKYMAQLQKVAQGGATTPKDLVDVLQDLTALKNDRNNPVGQALAGKMRDALDGDLQKLEDMRADPTMPQLDDSVKTILDTRKEYRRAQDAIRQLSDSASYKLLGLNKKAGGVDATADDALANLKAMTPEKRDSVRRFLDDNSPDLLVSLKDAVVKDAAKRAGTVRAAADSQQDLDNLLDGMFDAKNGYDMRTSGLWNAEELKSIEGIKNGMRTVANNRPTVGSAGTPVKPEDVAINLVSRSAPFIARQMTRVLTGAQGSKFFTDPRVYERLSKINRSTTGPAGLLARASLIDILNTDYLDKEAQ